MKAQERLEQYSSYMRQARNAFEADMQSHCWTYLLLAAEVSWTSSTAKQQRQRKLWVERGQLELALANIKSVLPLSSGYIRDNLVAARSSLQHMIEHNKHQMRNL